MSPTSNLQDPDTDDVPREMSPAELKAFEEAKRAANLREAQIVAGLLKEYADKLAAINTELIATLYESYRGDTPHRAAWLLDQGELFREPLTRIASRGSSLLEHARVDRVCEDELAMRMREIDVHLHHMLRLTHELRRALEADGPMAEQVARLRYAAGLSGMKGGPLRPN